MLFLPLYFALSGLSTNLGLLNDGITWGYVIGVIAVAFAGKIIGGTLAARLNRLEWRESITIGCLMSCKGLVELIVLVSTMPQKPTQLLQNTAANEVPTEHRSAGQDSFGADFYHVRRHGFGKSVPASYTAWLVC